MAPSEMTRSEPEPFTASLYMVHYLYLLLVSYEVADGDVFAVRY